MFQIGNLYVITAIAVIGGGLFGFDIASMSAIISEQGYLCYFNQQGMDGHGNCKGPTASTQGGITAAMPGGSWLGALVSGYLTDLLGRKRAIQLGCVCWIIGSVISCASQDIAMLIVGRVINGFCVGIASAQVPVYISELAPPSKRGRMVGIQQWAITWGILIMFYISYGTSFINNASSFRIPWGLQMIPAIFLLLALFIMPESPRWLGRKGRWEEAHQVLALVHAKGDLNNDFVLTELQQVREICDFEARNADVTYWELFTPKMINRTQIGLFTQVYIDVLETSINKELSFSIIIRIVVCFRRIGLYLIRLYLLRKQPDDVESSGFLCSTQLTGMNVMMYYITYVFTMAGQKGSVLLLSSSIQYIINVLMTVPALIWIDRWGRRPTLLIGSTLMAIWMFTNAGILAGKGIYKGPDGYHGQAAAQYVVHGSASKALIACTYLFVASYAPTWGPVSWIYPPELYPLRVRGKAVALATSGNWAFNFALGYFVPPAFVNIAWKTYVLFGVFLVVMTIHVFFFFPETAGKTLEETNTMFEDPNGIKYIGTPAWKTKKGFRKAQDMERGLSFGEPEIGGIEKRHIQPSSDEESSPERHTALANKDIEASK